MKTGATILLAASAVSFSIALQHIGKAPKDLTGIIVIVLIWWLVPAILAVGGIELLNRDRKSERDSKLTNPPA